MKNFNLKSFVLGIGVAALVAGFSVTAFAAVNEFLTNQVNIGLNGKQVAAIGEDYTLGNALTSPVVSI